MWYTYTLIIVCQVVQVLIFQDLLLSLVICYFAMLDSLCTQTTHDGRSSSFWKGHPSQTSLKVGTRQSTSQTLLPCRIAGDRQRPPQTKTQKKCMLKTDVLGPWCKVAQKCNLWHYNQISTRCGVLPRSPTRQRECRALTHRGVHQKWLPATPSFMLCRQNMEIRRKKNILNLDNTKRQKEFNILQWNTEEVKT